MARAVELFGGGQQALARRCQARTAAAGAAHAAVYQRLAGQVGERVDGLPGRLVADAGAARRLRDGAMPAHQVQDFHALVRRAVPECGGGNE